MLTPNDVKKMWSEIENRIEAKASQIMPLRTIRETLTTELYETVLHEIAMGSIDPKSLALAALKEER